MTIISLQLSLYPRVFLCVEALERQTGHPLCCEWTDEVNDLVRQISEWVREKSWTLDEHTREIREEILGAYSVPDLTIDTPHGRLLLEVKARGAVDGPGRVELAAWPTLYRVMLLHRMGQEGWTIRTDSGISLRQPWTKETFLILAEDLLAAS